MQFKQDASVYSADGEKVGQIERVVIDPDSREITHVIVRRGALFTEDRVIPVELVATTSEDQATLRADAGDLGELPYFEVNQYVNLDQEEIDHADYPADFAPPLYWYPSGGAPPIGYPGYPGQPHIIKTERNIPDDTVAVGEGAEVISAEGERVGEVEKILTDPDDNVVTHFVISKGVLFEEHKLVPVAWVDKVEETKIHLSVGSGLLEDLPEYEH